MDTLTFDLQRFASEEAIDTLNTVSDIVITGTANFDEYDIALNDTGTKIITLTEDNDSYENEESNVIIQALGGDDVINSHGSGVSKVAIDGGIGNDTITNNRWYNYEEVQGDDVTISGGAGDDVICNVTRGGIGKRISIDGGSGNDSIDGGGSIDATILGGDGDDTIESDGDNAKIDGGSGNDYITSNGDGKTIDAGDGNDSVRNFGSNASIDAGTGDDSIYNVGSNTTINASEGNNTVENWRGDSVSINGGLGNDSITTYNGSDVTISASEGNNTIENNVGDSAKIDTGAGDDSIYSSGDNVIINAGEGNNTVENSSFYANNRNYGLNVTIETGDGDDLITNDGNSKINAGEGDNTIINNGSGANINTGAGNDSIYNSGSSVTIGSGDGNDYIESGSHDYSSIDAGAGDDTIENGAGFNSINGGVGNDSITSDGHDHLIMGGKDNDTIESKDNYNTIDGGDGNDYITSDGYSNSIDGGDGNDYIYSREDTNVTINGGAGDDTIISGGSYRDYGGTINAGAGNDQISLGSDARYRLIEYTAGDGNDTIEGFNGDDTLSISGDYSTTKSGNDIILTVGDGSILFKDAADEDIHIDGIETIDSTTLILTNEDKATITIGSSVKIVDASTRTKAVKITGNDLDNTITGGTKNDTLDGGSGNNVLTGGNGKDIFIASGNATITDYVSKDDKISLGATISDVELDDDDNVILSFGDESLTIQNGADKPVTLLNGKKSTAYIFDDHKIFDDKKKAVTLTAGDDFDASTYSALVTIDASQTDGVEIRDNSKANKIWFGDGEDVFVWAKGGNDTIYNFDEGDLVSISGRVTDASVTKKGATILNVGKNKLTFDNTTEVKFTDDGGTKIFAGGIFYSEDETSATLPASFNQPDVKKTPLELDYATIDAAEVKKALNISLGDGNDSIHGGKKGDSIHGGAGDDTLWGGAGNDSLWGDDGADKFIWQKGDGKDVIFGFDDADMLEIIGLGGDVSGTLNKAGTELTVKVGKTAVAVLKDFTATDFNINDDTYQISGKALVKS